MVRLAYGRLLSRAVKGKSAKDTPAARRAAVLGFLGRLPANELGHFVYLMVRPFIPYGPTDGPTDAPTDAPTDFGDLMDGDEAATRAIRSLARVTAADLVATPTSRINGFLELLKTLVQRIGHHTVAFVPEFTRLSLAILHSAESSRLTSTTLTDGLTEGLTEGEEAAPASASGGSSRKATSAAAAGGAVRSLCLRVLTDLIEQFHTVHR